MHVLAHLTQYGCNPHIVVDGYLATFLHILRIELILSVACNHHRYTLPRYMPLTLTKFHHLCMFHNYHWSPQKVHNLWC